jgi:hypothetical protein
VAFLDEPLQRAARNGWKFCPQKSVKPLRRQRFFDDEIFSSICHPQITQIFADEIYDLFLIGAHRRNLRKKFSFGLYRFRRVLVFPGNEENESNACANRAVGDIERGEADFISTALLHVKINEIHDGVAAGQQPVGEISGDAAENESERNLSSERVRVKMVSREKQGDEREQCDERERAIVAAKQAPRRASVAPVDEFEEAVDDDFFVARFEQGKHEPFGELVERKDDERERGDAAVRFLENSHLESKVQSPKSKVKTTGQRVVVILK